MAHTEYWIVVVDTNLKWRNSPVNELIGMGVPKRVALRWARVRREMTPAGLKRKAAARRN